MGTLDGAVTPLAFAVLAPPDEPQLLFRRDPPVPDLQLHEPEVEAETVREVPVLWISGGALSQDPIRSTVRDARDPRTAAPHGPRSRLPAELLALAR